ncbi:unnamed protein product [Pleuronectes platessa]|uniref:Uncharacterized protein n=1 Tax=Pleuronectes platessa TaxID=8262 RepID=A0A9N7VC47_PLEPL|nr:unnamed protein product [Pleuronectes platessa]
MAKKSPLAYRGGLRFVAPHLYSLLTGTSLQPNLLTWGAVGLGEDPADSKRVLVWGVDVGEGASTAGASLIRSVLGSTSHIQPRLGPSQTQTQSLLRARGSQLMSLILRRQRSSHRLRLQSLLCAREVLTASSAPVPVPCLRVPADATLVPASDVLVVLAPVPVPRRRVPADATLVPASEVLAVTAPVPVPRRRVPADATLVPASEVLAVPAPVPAPRRRLLADVPCVPASEVLAVPAPVPVPRRRVPADATLSPVSEVLSVPAPVPAPVPVPRRRVPADASMVPASEVFAVSAPVPAPVPAPVLVPRQRIPVDPLWFRSLRSSRCQLRLLPHVRRLRSEHLPSAPDRSSDHPSEELPCLAPDRPSEPQNSAFERPRRRWTENLGTSWIASSGYPLLPPVAVHVLGRLASGP